MRLTGRVLVLYEDPDLIARQLAGEDIPYTGQSLAFGVNTDQMISGGNCTRGYTTAILGPYFLQNFKGVVTKDAVKNGGFQVIVGGDAYGTGSSREVAVVAHQGAGIELVIACGFNRILLENMVFSGVPCTTDFNVLRRLQEGEDVDVSQCINEFPQFFQIVSRADGLLPLARSWLAGNIQPWYETIRGRRPMTIIEKILASHGWAGGTSFGLGHVCPGEQVLCQTDFRGLHEYTAAMCFNMLRHAFGDSQIHDNGSVICFRDHFVLIGHEATSPQVRDDRFGFAQVLTDDMIVMSREFGVQVHGPNSELPEGICHRLALERYAVPGSLVTMTDSHTPTSGAVNCCAIGIGSTSMTCALRTGFVPVTVPKTVRVLIEGDAKGIISPKDLIMYIIGMKYFRDKEWQQSSGDTCVIQFGGSGLGQWTLDGLSVLTNMCAEADLMSGVIEPCDPIAQFLTEQHGNDMSDRMVYPDGDAEYAATFTINLSDVPLSVAKPGDSRNWAPLSDHTHVKIDNVVFGSCTGASRTDLQEAYQVLRGRTLHESVRVTVSPSSADVAAWAEDQGILEHFRSLGALVTPPGCGACIGNGPGTSDKGRVTASTSNRNFANRMGGSGEVWLVSPVVAAATAVTGHLTDPRSL